MSVSENSAARTCNDFPHLNRMKFRALIDRITVIHSYGMSLIVDTEGASCDVATCINAVSCDRNCRSIRRCASHIARRRVRYTHPRGSTYSAGTEEANLPEA